MTRMEIVSAENCQASLRTKMSSRKMPRENVLFMVAAPCSDQLTPFENSHALKDMRYRTHVESHVTIHTASVTREIVMDFFVFFKA